MLTHSPTSGRLRMTSIRLPIHMLAMSPQNNVGRSTITIGPGAIPWIISAPRNSAIVAQIGRAHVCTPVTNAHLVCRLLLEKTKTHTNTPALEQPITHYTHNNTHTYKNAQQTT